MFLRLLSKASLRWRRNQLWCLLCSGQRAAIIAMPLPTNGHNKHADGGGDMQMHTITFLTLLPEVLVISQVKPPQRGEQAAAWLLRFLWEWSRRSKKGSLYRTLLSSHSVCLDTHTWLWQRVIFCSSVPLSWHVWTSSFGDSVVYFSKCNDSTTVRLYWKDPVPPQPPTGGTQAGVCSWTRCSMEPP